MLKALWNSTYIVVSLYTKWDKTNEDKDEYDFATIFMWSTT